MDTELMIIHIVFISACVVSSWYMGRKEGASKAVTMLLQDEVITIKDLQRYSPEEQ
jgi:hypothetical protein